MLLYYLIFTFFLLFDHTLGQEQPLVETSLGKIKGHYKRSYGGRTFSAFEGIPYAKPPIGDLRFEEPLSIESWSGIWEATIVHECMQTSMQVGTQIGMQTFQPQGSEDCLYLNVYVPKEQPIPNENLDVVVHIHGGAFMLGNPQAAGPEFLMDRNIVYVTLNYRLGVLGFLSTEDNVVSGNNGMKDQVLALKWVQNHIEKFGGNPKSVTITGLSAGGAAVHLHYFSPLTKGLFHRGISQSGTALAPWVIQKDPLTNAKKIAASIGCDSPASKEFIQCLKRRPANQLLQNVYNISPFPGLPIAPFAPVIEKESKGAFLTDYPYKLINRKEVNDVPWITSATTEEGMLGLSYPFIKLDALNEHWSTILPYLLDYHNTVDDSDKHDVAEKINQFYFDGKKITNDSIPSFIKLVGDRFFILDLEKSARLHAKLIDSPVYCYIYGYKREHNLGGLFASIDKYGVGHGEDGLLVYKITFNGVTLNEGKLSESDERFKEMLLDMVTSFAKNGQPKVEGINWETVNDSKDFRYLFIRSDGIEMASENELAPSEFWHSLPIKENENLVALKDEL